MPLGTLKEFDAALQEWIAGSRELAPGGKTMEQRPLPISADWARIDRADRNYADKKLLEALA